MEVKKKKFSSVTIKKGPGLFFPDPDTAMHSTSRVELMAAVDQDRQTPDTHMFFTPFMNTGEADPLFIRCAANKTFYRHV